MKFRDPKETVQKNILLRVWKWITGGYGADIFFRSFLSFFVLMLLLSGFMNLFVHFDLINLH